MGGVIDSHQHFWCLDRGGYDWLTPDLDRIYRDFMPIDLAPLMIANGVEQSILVQASPSIEETQFLLSLAEQYNFINGVVGWVDMAGINAGSQLEMLAQNPFFKGIRPMIQDIYPEDWMLDRELVPAFEKLAALQLSFDALVRPVHLDSLLVLAKTFDGLDIVIDHAAKPDIANNQLHEWSEKIRRFSALPNVYCKLSGLLTEMGQGQAAEHLEPYVKCLLDTFGPSRLMWGSDWPVMNIVTDYSEWHAMVVELLQELNADEKAQVMSRTAQNFYRL